MFSFKGVNQFEPDKVPHFDLDGHGAAVGCTRVAHANFVASPALRSIDVDDADGGFHSGQPSEQGGIKTASSYFLNFYSTPLQNPIDLSIPLVLGILIHGLISY
jgi:hypothetical protein